MFCLRKKSFLFGVLAIYAHLSLKVFADANLENENQESLVNVDKRSLDSSNVATNKNDGSHIRLYYKSNSPDRSISHELEHRLVKNPNYQFNNGRVQQIDDFNSPLYKNNFQSDQLQTIANTGRPGLYNKNKQTLLNLHYHGNSLEPSNQFVAKTLPADSNNINANNNLLKMLLNFNNQPSYQMLKPPISQSPQIPFSYEQLYNQPRDKGVQYKIAHFKFQIEPQYQRGIIQSNSGFPNANNENEQRNSGLIPKEIPELIKLLLNSAQDQINSRVTPQQSQKSFDNLSEAFYSNGMRVEPGLLNKREIDPTESKQDDDASRLLLNDSQTSENHNNYESQNMVKAKRGDAEDEVNSNIEY